MAETTLVHSNRSSPHLFPPPRQDCAQCEKSHTCHAEPAKHLAFSVTYEVEILRLARLT